MLSDTGNCTHTHTHHHHHCHHPGVLSDTGNYTHTHTHTHIIIIIITQVCYLIQVTAHRHIITVESESERTLNEVLADLRNKIPPPMTFLAKEKILHTVTMG